jgi:hypothetical protein
MLGSQAVLATIFFQFAGEGVIKAKAESVSFFGFLGYSASCQDESMSEVSVGGPETRGGLC